MLCCILNLLAFCVVTCSYQKCCVTCPPSTSLCFPLNSSLSPLSLVHLSLRANLHIFLSSMTSSALFYLLFPSVLPSLHCPSPPAWWCGGQVQGRSGESSQTQLWWDTARPAAILQASAAQEAILPAGRNSWPFLAFCCETQARRWPTRELYTVKLIVMWNAANWLAVLSSKLFHN